MPKMLLTQQFSDNPPVNRDKPKIDYFDTRLTGFFLEVRASGKATYYQRYRDRHGRNRQVRLGPADAMTIEAARDMARQIRSRITNGFDPCKLAGKLRETPAFKEFIANQYLPHVKVYKRSWQRDETMIANPLLPIWGRARLSEITREDVQLFQADMLANGYKPGTVNRRMALVKFIFSLAEKWEAIDKSPARGIPKVADNIYKERFLTKDETKRLPAALKQCHSPAVPDLIEFLLLTGARNTGCSYSRYSPQLCIFTGQPRPQFI